MSQSASRHFRAHGRKGQSLAARVRALGGGQEEEATLVDLGLGGACLELREGMEPGREIVVRLGLPGLWDLLDLTAEVAWRSGENERGLSRMGVRFVRPSGKSLRLLSEALAAEYR